MIGVEDHWNAVLLGHGADVEGARYGASDGSSVVFVVKSFSTVELLRERGMTPLGFLCDE